MNTIIRQSLLVGGQVQGVGFRPFVYRCALRHGLSGNVGNTSRGVEIQVQGSATAVAAFVQDLHTSLPPLARITSCVTTAMPALAGETGFSINSSQAREEGATRGGGHTVLVSPDVALCQDCLNDMKNPDNRRYGYPFTNCTNCGPRYTITRSIPYDRATTSMSCFPLCPDCAREYTDPLDRRFHAQPNACPVCGPALWVVEGPVDEGSATALSGSVPEAAEGNYAALSRIALALRQGRIAAVKGLGGFQLACDAFNEDAIALLRQRKHRPHKALAVMVPDIESARALARLSPGHEALLQSAEAPIVICPKREAVADDSRYLGNSDSRSPALPGSIAPDGHSLGLMLPYTPLHRALFDIYAPLCPVGKGVGLVMTSGNAGGEPICLGNREALRRLSQIADIFLLHNRDILVRADDSVVTLSPHSPRPVLYRRARGYVPRPLTLAPAQPPIQPSARDSTAGPDPSLCIMGVGAELKSTLCLTRGDAAFVSQHIGDLQNLETYEFYQELETHLETLLEVRPAALVCDLHPDYMSSHFAREYAAQRHIPLLRLQHHAAHGWSVLAENGHVGPALVWALDGTGLGSSTSLAVLPALWQQAQTQGHSGNSLPEYMGPEYLGPNLLGGELWGGELLLIDTEQLTQERIGSLRAFPLPGGDTAVREPWRVAQALLSQEGLHWQWPEAYAKQAAFIEQMIAKNVQCPNSSSLGRLFDAVAALLGLCHAISYEGQAALRLQEAQEKNSALPVRLYPLRILPPCDDSPLWRLDSHDLFRQVYSDLRAGQTVPAIARAFHLSLAQGLADMAALAAARHKLCHVGLSGGVMQNPTLHHALPAALVRHRLIPLLHQNLPPNDACISFGQAAFGRAALLRH